MNKIKSKGKAMVFPTCFFLLALLALPAASSADICEDALEECLGGAAISGVIAMATYLILGSPSGLIAATGLILHCLLGYVWCKEFVG